MTATQGVLVRAVEGLWHHAGYNAASRRFEIRRLVLQQEGQALRGTFSMNGGPEQPISGALSGERNARLVADGQQFEGTITAAVNGEGATWPLLLQDGTASGQTLTFKPAFGEPSSPPVANLQLIQPAGFIIEGLEIGFDASASSGEDLTYFVEYGDGRHTTEAVSRHAPETSGHLTPRLTVVDRFGRDGVATPRLDVENLESNDPKVPYEVCMGSGSDLTNPANGRREFRDLKVTSHEGRQVIGLSRHPDFYPPPNRGYRFSRFSGSLTGSRDIQFVLDGGGIEFRGTLGRNRVNAIPPHQLFSMLLTLRGGSADTQQLLFDEYIIFCGY